MRKGFDYIGNSVVFACHDGEGNYLFNKRSMGCRDERGVWDIGGGGIEPHDTVVDTLKKEIAEEYCTDVLEYEFLGYRDVHRDHQGENNNEKTHWIALDFKVLINRAKASNGEPRKFEEIGWFKLDEKPGPNHSQLPEFLEKYADKL